MAEWFVPIGAEGLLPGAKNRDQSVLGQMGLMFLGIGSREYNKQQRNYQATERDTERRAKFERLQLQ